MRPRQRPRAHPEKRAFDSIEKRARNDQKGKHEAVENPLGEHRPRDGEPRGACQLMRRLDTDSVAAAGRDEVVDRGADGQGGEEPRRRRLHPSGGEKRTPANGADKMPAMVAPTAVSTDVGGRDARLATSRPGRACARNSATPPVVEPATSTIRTEGRRRKERERGHASSFVASAPPSHRGQPPESTRVLPAYCR